MSQRWTTWTCQLCTYENEPYALQCAMCYTIPSRNHYDHNIMHQSNQKYIQQPLNIRHSHSNDSIYNPPKRSSKSAENKQLSITNQIASLFSSFNQNGNKSNPYNTHDNLIKLLGNEKLTETASLFGNTNIPNIEVKQTPNICELQQCNSFLRIRKILSNYATYNISSNQLESNSIHKNVYENGKYNTLQILNDFNHILRYHVNDEFEHIYDKLLQILDVCDLSNCQMIQRNHRTRSSITNNEHTLSQLYPIHDDIVYLQTLDRIHCYFLHTFDIGYKLTKTEREMHIGHEIKIDQQSDDIIYDENIVQIHNVTKRKQQQHRKLQEMRSAGLMYNKFITNASKNANQNSNKMNEYSYGYRYFYWEYYKTDCNRQDKAGLLPIQDKGSIESHTGLTNAEWYIAPKENNLKQELVNNKICFIGILQWKTLVQKAGLHLQTDHLKELSCARRESATYYEMKYEDPMKPDHVIALMVYCSFDQLQFQFSATYRKRNGESDKQLKERHSNYYWMGRRLRECTECFGMTTSSNKRGFQDNLKLYHGVNQLYTFPSINAYIRCPFSTTADEAVALNFCNNKGLVLEIEVNILSNLFRLNESKTAITRIRCFNCVGVSDYPNEAEVLFIGGSCPIKIMSIKTPNGINYAKYIAGLRQLIKYWNTDSFSLDFLHHVHDKETKWEKSMEFRLLSHEIWTHFPNYNKAFEFKSCPDYFKRILHLQCINIKQMPFFNKVRNPMKDFFFKNKGTSWIKLEVIMTIFPNVDTIWYEAIDKDWSFVNNLRFLGSILLFITKYPNTKLRQIDIIIAKSCVKKMESEIERYKKLFNKYSWCVAVRGGQGSIKEFLDDSGFDLEALAKTLPQCIAQLQKTASQFGFDINEHLNVTNLSIVSIGKYVETK